MSEKPVTIIISDLHLGGGKADPGDDHIYQGNQLCRFLEEMPDASRGNVELFINGDFLEFAQVKPQAFKSESPDFWCSEEESKAKLNAILKGHADIFLALQEFQRKGNQVTISAGNHDVDLYWPSVQNKLKKKIGKGTLFELGKDIYYRYGTRLVIGHGHKYDLANRFKKWGNPINKRTQRLEMCPGTLFMVKFVNELEKKYPFTDNIKPVTALFRLLWREKKRKDLKTGIRILMEFAYKNFSEALDMEVEARGGYNDWIQETGGMVEAVYMELASNPIFAKKMASLYAIVRGDEVTPDTVQKRLSTESKVKKFLKEMVLRVEPEKWLPVFKGLDTGVLSIDGDDDTHLSIILSRMTDEVEELKRQAELYLDYADVVVFGHTHQPDEWRGANNDFEGGYFNPGSWTRYIDLKEYPHLKIADLMREEDFPYQLNFIRVERTQAGKLHADKICFEEQNGDRFKPTPRAEKFMKKST